MASLFSKSSLQKAISVYEGLDLHDKIDIIKSIYQDHLSGNTRDETRYEQRFNNLFFGQLLGYEENINRHPKASTPIGSKIADVGLGFFEEGKYNFEGVKVVVELKGSGTVLDKKQVSYGGQSPVDQGFGYKTSFKDCPWLIVSNFYSIRLYRDNKQDFEVWTLEQLVNPDNGYYHLRTLLGLLRRDRLITESGKSYTETLLSEVRINQEKITKSFYKEYKGLRSELINDIRHHNPSLDVEIVVEKAQKIIDRIVFILFCEDKGLLPEHKLLERVREYQKRGRSPRQSLIEHFIDIDQGNPAIGIPQYNGGLFRRDEVLKSIQVGDTICRKFIDLGKYNFDDELSVNILGHIFEQSISDIEQLKIELIDNPSVPDGTLILQGDKKESKRKKDGIFYTPEYIVDYIVQNSLMKYLEEKEQECLDKVGKRGGYKTEPDAYKAYQQILHNIKVLDPACGSGAFLVKVFDYLYAENKRVGQIVGGLFDVDEIYKSILRNNIYGVDLNPESVEITKLSLWLKSAQKGKKLNNLDDNIKCGNSLIDDPAVAGERAFDWQKEFSDIMGAGGFDVIVGNPPYVTVKVLSKEDKNFYLKKYQVATGQFDLYILFYEQGYNLLKKDGILSYISPSTFISNKDYYTFRKYILSNSKISEIINLGETVFSDANLDVAILSFIKSINYSKIKIIKNRSNFDYNIFEYIEQKRFIEDDFSIEINLNNNEIELFKKLYNGKILLSEILDLPRGIEFGSNSDKIFKGYIEKAHKIIFGKSIDRYFLSFDNDFVFYENNISTFKSFKIYENEKILIQRIRNLSLERRIIATYDNDKYLCTNTLRIGCLKNKNFNLKYILSLLNSKLINFIFLKKFLNKDIYSFQLQKVPIPEIPLSEQQPFIEKADLMLLLNKELHEKIDFTLRFLQSKFNIIKPTTKLQKFWELDFAQFTKELKIRNLSIDLESELMKYFEKEKSEILDLRNKIDITDKEIDEMVFDLYGLSEEEIQYGGSNTIRVCYNLQIMG